MKIKGKQDIEYWVTTARNGAMIRVYRIDAPEEQLGDRFNPFQVPILVDFHGSGESIADILEERTELKRKIEHYGEEVSKARSELHDYKDAYRKRKWYQFWK